MILGLDIGTNSIGAALITINEFGKEGSVKWMGSRIIPLDGDSLTKFENGGQVETKAANRRLLRGSRRLKQRYKLRRSRLTKVLKQLGWVSNDFPTDFKQLNRNGDFSFNINTYLPVSDETKQEAYTAFGTDKISDDWLVYFLRKKALEQRLTLSELARIIYMLNQRRGFKSSRKELPKQEETDEEKWPKIEKWIEIVTVESIKETGKEKDKTIYEVNAGPYQSTMVRRYKPDWQGKTMELEITRKTTKAGEIAYVLRTPETSDWEKKKKALHDNIQEWLDNGLCRTIGEYFAIHLIEDKNYRIRQQIIDREFYRKELETIWQKQASFHSELANKQQLPAIAKELYKNNKEKQKEIEANDLFYAIANDIIYYQRPLKSQKNSVDQCRFEKKRYIQDGEEITVGVKVAPKSSPLFQEFRIWQDIHNLRVYEREQKVDGKVQMDADVTEHFITPETKEALFRLFDANGEVSSIAILRAINRKLADVTHRINLFANRDKLKGNETKAAFRKVFKKHLFDGEALLQEHEVFEKLWHIQYSLSEESEVKAALQKLKDKEKKIIELPTEVINHLSKLPELPRQYAAYSSKAIKKLLPLMRCGSFWNQAAISEATKRRIEKIIDAEWDEAIDDRTRQLMQKYSLEQIDHFTGLPVWLATYVVYGKHSERDSDEKYKIPAEIDVAKLIPTNSLRNPFVEQIIRETIQVVKCVWENYGQPDEIHIELARELKKTAEEKADIAEANSRNEAEKQRIKVLLKELKEGNPQSLSDVEKFRLWKANGGFESNQKFEELFNKRNELVSNSEVEKYRLWADQNHLSPYTGKAIPLSLLFTPAYEVEHIFPRSRFFDDSFANKIICETGVNKEKDKTIARLFIQQYSGRTFERDGKKHTILDEETYVANCKRIFKGKKLRNLLSDSIPEGFVSRQLNDTRHISKKLAELLYPVAKEKEGIIFTGGNITSELKDRWGLNKVWKETIKPRFERLEGILGETMVIPDPDDRNKFHFAKEYKRVDHRHHALDALIIAATTREHIRYLNTLNATTDAEKYKFGLVKRGIRDFILPWPNFTQEAKRKLAGIIVSHKATNRVVTKPFNRYLKWVETNGEVKKAFVLQQQPTDYGKSWSAVRRSMFKEPQGIVYLKEMQEKKLADAIAIQIKKMQTQNRTGAKPADYIYDQTIRPQIKSLIHDFKSDLTAIKTHLKKNPLKDAAGAAIEKVRVAIFKEYAAKRVTLDKTFDEKKINKIPYANQARGQGKNATLPQLLREHLAEQGKPETAFAGEGLDLLHKKLGYPLKKVTIYEAKDPESKFKGRYYETDKGGNIFFVIKQSNNGNREMYTLPLVEAIERLANKLPLVDIKEGETCFTLSPNELVYVPAEGEDIKAIDWSDTEKLFGKVYKMVSCTGGECHFLPHNIANLLVPYNAQTKKGEFGSLNKSENSTEGLSIKRICIKLKTDRLGNIGPA